MDQYQDTSNSAHDQAEAAPSQGPPQFNQRNCGYCGQSRCGCSCDEDDGGSRGGRTGREGGVERGGAEEDGGGGVEEEEGEGQAAGESDEETLLGSGSEAALNLEYHPDGNNIRMARSVHSSSPVPLRMISRSPLPIINHQLVQFRLLVPGWEIPSSRSQSSYNRYSAPGSMDPEPYESGEHDSIDSSRSEIPRFMSPGPDLREIELVYHFLIEPLRLSPHYRDCRGSMSSHWVTRDEVSFMDDD